MTNESNAPNNDHSAFKAQIAAGQSRKQRASGTIVIRLPQGISPGAAVEALVLSTAGRGKNHHFYEVARDPDRRWVEVHASYTAVGASEDDLRRKIARTLNIDKNDDMSFEPAIVTS